MKSNPSKLLAELKRRQTKRPISLEQVLVIFHEGQINTKQAHRFLAEKHKNNPNLVNWQQLSVEEIQQIFYSCKNYIRAARQKWKKQQQKTKKKQQQESALISRQKDKLRNQMAQKNINRLEMIKVHTQLIKKYEDRMEGGVEDSEQQKQMADQIGILKHELKILQRNDWDVSGNKQMQIKAENQTNEAELQQIIREIKERWNKEEREHQRGKLEIMAKFKQEQSDAYQSKLKRVMSKLRDVYYYYSKSMYTPGTTFEDNSKYMQLIDMKIFIKYLREFQINLYREDDQLMEASLSKITNSQMVNERKSNQTFKRATLLFKQLAQHGVWMDFASFVSFHFRFVGSRENLSSPQIRTIIERQMGLMKIQDTLLTDKKKSSPKIKSSSRLQRSQSRQYEETEQQETVGQKLIHLNNINSLLSKDKFIKLKIPSVQVHAKYKATSKILTQLQNSENQKQSIMERMARQLQESRREKQILAQKITQAKKLMESKKKRGELSNQHSAELVSPKKYQRIGRVNSDLLKPISEQKTSENKYGHRYMNTPLKSDLTQSADNQFISSSLPKLSSKPKSIYESMKNFKVSNQMSEFQADTLTSKRLFEQTNGEILSYLTKPQGLKNEDQQFLNQYFSRERTVKKKKGMIQKHVNPQSSQLEGSKIRAQKRYQQLIKEPPRMKFT